MFAVMFLPGYLAQAGASEAVAADAFDNPLFHLQNLAVGVPHILLLLFIVKIRQSVSLDAVGWVRIKPADILLGVTAAASALALSVAVTTLFSLIAGGNTRDTFSFAGPSATMLPAVVATGIVTGYREELFFRSYLITRLRSAGIGAVPAVATSVFLFSIGHLYQGLLGFFVTIILGLFFSILYLYTGKLHTAAIGHAGYNILALYISNLLIPG